MDQRRDVGRADKTNNMKRAAFAISLVALAGAACAESIKLLCITEANRGTQRASKDEWVYEIDLTARTVNGQDASIRDDDITFRTSLSSGDTITISINRVTAFIVMNSKNLGRLADGYCKVAGDRKF